MTESEPRAPRIPPPPPTNLPKTRYQPREWPRSRQALLEARELASQNASASYRGKRMHLALEHLEAIQVLHQPNSIATLAYDAMRAAVDVHLNANSLQIEAADKHQTAVEYAHSEMSSIIDAAHLETYDELRQMRNKVLQYPDIGTHAMLDAQDAERYGAAAVAIVGAVRDWVAGRT